MVTQGCAASSSLETIGERSLTIGGGGGGGRGKRTGKFWGEGCDILGSHSGGTKIFWARI